jgi:hypothetical protein
LKQNLARDFRENLDDSSMSYSQCEGLFFDSQNNVTGALLQHILKAIPDQVQSRTVFADLLYGEPKRGLPCVPEIFFSALAELDIPRAIAKLR